MSNALFQVKMETAEELIERVVKNHAITAVASDVSGIPMTMSGDVDTAKGPLYYRLQVSDEPFDDPVFSKNSGDEGDIDN